MYNIHIYVRGIHKYILYILTIYNTIKIEDTTTRLVDFFIILYFLSS